MKPYPGEDFDDAADRLADEAVQRDVDADEEPEARAIETSLQDASIEGQRAGHLGLGASLNPYQTGYPEHDAWERARSCVIGAWLNGSLRRIA